MNLDLSHLVENAVEGVFVGHNYRTSGPLDTENHSSGNGGTWHNPPEKNIMVILSIASQTSWTLESEVGSWKRIIMNLVGNALKYTTSGFAHISLRADMISADSTGSARQVITLQIEDSGKGMSKDYLKHGLFTPFTQEDPHAVGTGLGMSIVRQLVTDLGGNIDVQSEVGYGTTINVSIPSGISSNPLDPMIQESNSLITDIRTRSRGLRLCLIGFEYYPDISETPSGLLSAHARCMLAIKSSLAAMAADWFDLEVTTASSVDSANGDILMGLRSKLNLVKRPDVPILPLIIFEDTIAGNPISDRKGEVRLSQP